MESGTRLGPYEVVAKLGEGGMGDVYRARDTRLDRSVALKVSKEAFSDRFEREARAVAALNHPNICTLHDVGPNYLVMELVDGVPLAGPMPVEKAVEYAGQILDALEAAHRQGITHRDLKPANILVTKQGIKLLDFGLATRASPMGASDDATVAALTQQGQIVGTLQYMAPEQLQGQPADARSDIFAFGCVLYELLSGKRAFDGSSQASVIAAILEREPAPLQQHPPLDRVIATCLAKDPDARFQTARDLKRALTWAMEPMAGGAVVTVPSPVMRRASIALAAVTLLAVIAAGYFALRPPAVPEPDAVVRFELPVDADEPTWSPDGKTIAWIGRGAGGGARQIFVRQLDQLEPRALDTPEGKRMFLAFSPDGQWLAYTHAPVDWSGETSEVRKVPVAGGPSELVAAMGPRALAWSGDTIYLCGGSEIFAVPASGGTPRSLRALDHTPGRPRAINGGRDLLWVGFSRVEGVPGSALWTMPSSGGEPRQVMKDVMSFDVAGTGHLIYTERASSRLFGRRFQEATVEVTGDPVPLIDSFSADFAVSSTGALAYSTAETPASEYVLVDRASSKVVQAFAGVTVRGNWGVTPDGRFLLGSEVTAAMRELWAWDVERAQRVPLSSELVQRFDVAVTTGAIFFDGRDGIFRLDRPWTSAPARVTTGQDFLMSVDPDGQRLVVFNDRGVELVTAGGSRARLPDAEYTISRDGQWVAAVTDGGARDELWIRTFPDVTSARALVSDSSPDSVFWSMTGSVLFYRVGGRWSSVTVRAGTSGSPIEVGRPVRIDVPAGVRLVATMPDNRLLGLRRLTPRPPTLAIVQNFFEELRAKVPVK